MSRVLATWVTPADRETINASPTREILKNRMRALDSIVVFYRRNRFASGFGNFLQIQEKSTVLRKYSLL